MSCWHKYHREKALTAAEEWRGLPHIDRRAIPGKGADCIHFVTQILFAAEILTPEPMPAYPLTWGLASATNAIAHAVASCTRSIRIPRGEWEPEFGDVVIWRCLRTSNHCGIVLGNQVWHVPRGGTVHPTPIGPIKRRIQEAIRITEKGWVMKPTEVDLNLEG